jgi:hypothetical protein
MLFNGEKLIYTYEHRQAVAYVAGRILDSHKYLQMYDRIQYHDLDKSLLNTIVPDTKLVSRYHKLTNPHHMWATNIHAGEFTYDDMLEAIIDYESSGYTKADKPLNAYDTICTASFMSDEIREKLLSILKEYNMDRSYRNTPYESDWIAYKNHMVPASEESIGREISCYASAVSDNPLVLLGQKYQIQEFTADAVIDAIKKEIETIEKVVS